MASSLGQRERLDEMGCADLDTERWKEKKRWRKEQKHTAGRAKASCMVAFSLAESGEIGRASCRERVSSPV